MLPPTPPESRQSTMSAATVAMNTSGSPGRKRKGMTSANPASTQAHSPKRVKTETTSTTEPRASRPVEILTDSIYDVIVTVKVGEMATSFGIHRGLLRRASKFFKEQLSFGETTESGVVAQVVVMKDEEPETFRRFNNWLYSGNIISESETCKSLAWADIIAIYTFADRNGIPRLQNSCVDTVIRKRKEGGLFPGPADVNTLWKAPGQVSRLQRLLVDMFARECNLKDAFARNTSYHLSFLEELVQTLFDMKERQTIYDKVDFWKKRQKNYYVDDNENPILVG